MAYVTKVTLVTGKPGAIVELPPGSYTKKDLGGLDLADLQARGFVEEVADAKAPAAAKADSEG